MVMRDDENHFFTINRLHEIRKNNFFVFLRKHDIFVRLFFQMKDGQKFPHFDKYPNFTIITNFLFEVFIKIMVVCRQMKKR